MDSEHEDLPTRCPSRSEIDPPRHCDAERARHIGSFEHDLASGKYGLQWKNMSEMESWKKDEEEKKTVEFITTKYKSAQHGTEWLWTRKYIFICSRAESGGKKHYQKKHAWDRAIPSKKIGCPCRLTVKTYPNTQVVLGLYNAEHSHETGNVNSRFTRLRKEDRQEIESLLRLGVEPKKVVSPTFILEMVHTYRPPIFSSSAFKGRYIPRTIY